MDHENAPVSDPAVEYMLGRGISEVSQLLHGVHYSAEYNAVGFPYYDVSGRARTTRWRTLDPSVEQKYLSPRGSHLGLYNVEDVDAAAILVCEGEIDTLSVKEYDLAGVGVPGAGNFRDAWRWLFVDKTVRIMFDGDKAGADGAHKVMRILSSVAANVEIVRLPDGSDVNSLHMAGALGGYL